MCSLKIFLLGPPRIERDGTLVEVDTRKAIALVAYLASTGEAHRRDALASLMWPDSDQSRGRAALRRTLSTLNGAFGGLGLDASRETIGLDWGDHIWVDLVAFHSSLQLCLTHGHSETQACDRCLQPLSDAVELYRGDFLSGFEVVPKN